MIIVRLAGGLGNQMFQYAFGRYLAWKYNTQLKLDLGFFRNKPIAKKGYVFRDYDLDIFNIEGKFATEEEVFKLSKRFKNIFLDKVFNKIFGYKKSYFIEPHFHFSDAMYNAPDNIYIEGYWQSEKYFYPIKQELKRIFTFKQDLQIGYERWLNEIKTTDSVCVHVRRGDYLINANHGFCGLRYYKEAEKIMSKKINNPHYFVFSDDIEWCRENLQFFPSVQFITKELSGYKDQDHLRMMSYCKNFIISNSSFSWWAVWLGENENNVVIAPSDWYKPAKNLTDIYQPGWIVI